MKAGKCTQLKQFAQRRTISNFYIYLQKLPKFMMSRMPIIADKNYLCHPFVMLVAHMEQHGFAEEPIDIQAVRARNQTANSPTAKS